MQLTPEQQEEYEERAAIMQFDGKMSRERAELEAYNLLLKKEHENGNYEFEY